VLMGRPQGQAMSCHLTEGKGVAEHYVSRKNGLVEQECLEVLESCRELELRLVIV
jgi:hypothetical protein